jgi:N-acyl-D-amino-acid deacylase
MLGLMKQTVIILTLTFGLTSGLQAQIPDFTPKTPLLGALAHNDLRQARRLLEEGANPNEGNFVGFPPLLVAIVRQDVDLVRMMVARGADLKARDRSGSTALMWAAFNETGDAAMVEELLRLGADPLDSNKAGETALTWALRRGETPAVAALRKAGASNTGQVRASAQKAVALLQKSGTEFSRTSGCASCHHQSLPQMALGIARDRGLVVDEEAAKAQVETVLAPLKAVLEEALRNRDRIPDPPIGISYALLGLAAERYQPDDVTAGLARVVASWQTGDGVFQTLPALRPPIESSEFTATALSLRAIQLYGTNPEKPLALARDWLRQAKPRIVEEQAMRLMGLAWAQAPVDEIRKSLKALLAAQQPDGGWAQLSSLETDAYATGQALVALQTAGHSVSSVEYQRGVAYLLRTQFPDGSWLVRTRTFPVQMPKYSGFPHGRHQWISAAGTSWAAMALMLSLPSSHGEAGG